MYQALERLKANIIPYPFVADHRNRDGSFFARKTDKLTALTMPMIQVNGPRCVRYLCFDIDRKLGALAWEDANLPIPNLIMTNPINGHAHIAYEIENAVWLKHPKDTRPGDAHPVRFLNAVVDAMKDAMGADKHYTGLLVKNPFHDAWVVTVGCNRPYTLSELSAHLDLSPKKKAKLVEDTDGRNCTLFGSLRLFAYRIVNEYREHGSFDSFKDSLWNELDRLNDLLSDPLSYLELKGILKSVAKWTWNKYTGNGKSIRRGAMGLASSDYSLREKQQLSQERTCDILVERTVDIIRRCIVDLHVEGISVTISEVSRRTTLSRNTVRRYLSTLTDLLTIKKTFLFNNRLTYRQAIHRLSDTLIPPHCSPPEVLQPMYTETFESGCFETLDKWTHMESSIYYEQRTTQRATRNIPTHRNSFTDAWYFLSTRYFSG